MGTVPFYIESENGHDTVEVPEDQVKEEVNNQIRDGKWVTVEKNDGSTKLHTKEIGATSEINATSETTSAENAEVNPQKEEEPETKTLDGDKKESKSDDWKNTFGANNNASSADDFKDVKSATATNKMKGG